MHLLFYIILCYHIVVKGFQFANTKLLHRMFYHSYELLTSAFIIV